MSCYLNQWHSLLGQIVVQLYLQLFSKAVCMVCSIKLITLMISTFCCWPPSMMETVWNFFGCWFYCSVDWLRDWFINDWFLLDESCFKLSISYCKCLICLWNPSSLVWFVDKFDREVFPCCFWCSVSLVVRLLFYIGLLLIFLFCLTFFLCWFCFTYVLICQNIKFFHFSRAANLLALLELLFD